MHEKPKTDTEGASRNSSGSSGARDLIVSGPSKDEVFVRTLAEDKSSAANLTKTLFALVLITEGV